MIAVWTLWPNFGDSGTSMKRSNLVMCEVSCSLPCARYLRGTRCVRCVLWVLSVCFVCFVRYGVRVLSVQRACYVVYAVRAKLGCTESVCKDVVCNCKG